jgi:hypothetical protein
MSRLQRAVLAVLAAVLVAATVAYGMFRLYTGS